MKRLAYFLLVFGVLGIYGMGCDAFSGDDTGGVVTLTGKVLDNATNNPVPGANVRILPLDLLFETDEDGNYSIEVTIDSTMDLRIVASEDGYTSASVTVLGLADRVIDVPTLRISRTVAEEQVSGQASNILLLRQSGQSIGVRESGSTEVANITFQVTDSLGRPVILDNSTAVTFTLGVQPGGGEFIFPNSAPTDNNGEVTVNLSSGTRAGVVQIVAETEVDDRVIRSRPVSVAIHGGLPHQAHFSLGPEQFNFPGLLRFGITNRISVLVGDEYSNPVKPGTAVYFESTHAVIEGSTLTSSTGQGSVQLISGNPIPPDGITVVTASTADKNEEVVTAETPVVLSGVPTILVSPLTAQLGQTYTLTIDDPNGNPLAPNTRITVRAEGTKVKAVGNTSLTLDDTFIVQAPGTPSGYRAVTGPGITEFTFRVVEDLNIDESGSPTIETVTITVAGPNGFLEIVLTPSGEPAALTDGATMRLIGPDQAQFQAPEQR